MQSLLPAQSAPKEPGHKWTCRRLTRLRPQEPLSCVAHSVHSATVSSRGQPPVSPALPQARLSPLPLGNHLTLSSRADLPTACPPHFLLNLLPVSYLIEGAEAGAIYRRSQPTPGAHLLRLWPCTPGPTLPAPMLETVSLSPPESSSSNCPLH